jgi:hypothetical protein
VDSAIQIREICVSSKGEPIADSYLDSRLISNAWTAVSRDLVDKIRSTLNPNPRSPKLGYVFTYCGAYPF